MSDFQDDAPVQLKPIKACAQIIAQRDRYAYLLVRARKELLTVLEDIKRNRIPFDGDDFHELLRDIESELSK